MAGRRPKSAEDKALTGNPGRRPIQAETPRAGPGIGEPPEFLSDEARAEWWRIVPELDKIQVLTRVDRAVVLAYCVNYGRWAEAEAKIQEFGAMVASPRGGMPVENPYLLLAERSFKSMLRAALELGITPASRSRVASVPEKTEVSKTARFFKAANS